MCRAGHKFHVFYSEDTHNADPLESFIASSSKQAHTIGPKGASASINKYKVASEIDLDEQEVCICIYCIYCMYCMHACTYV